MYANFIGVGKSTIYKLIKKKRSTTVIKPVFPLRTHEVLKGIAGFNCT